MGDFRRENLSFSFVPHAAERLKAERRETVAVI
jgi:hypothetical protein